MKTLCILYRSIFSYKFQQKRKMKLKSRTGSCILKFTGLKEMISVPYESSNIKYINGTNYWNNDSINGHVFSYTIILCYIVISVPLILATQVSSINTTKGLSFWSQIIFWHIQNHSEQLNITECEKSNLQGSYAAFLLSSLLILLLKMS